MSEIVSVQSSTEIDKKEFHRKLFLEYNTLLPSFEKFQSYVNVECEIAREIDDAKKKEISTFNHYAVVMVSVAIVWVFIYYLFVKLNFSSVIWFVVLLLLLIPLNRIAFKIYRSYYVKPKEKEKEDYIKQKEDELAEIIRREDEIVNSVKDKLHLIPKGYATYDALSYFVQVYQSGKAETLKEAIKLYDEEVHRRKMLNSQEAIYKQNQRMLQNQQNILNNQQVLQNEMNYLMFLELMK